MATKAPYACPICGAGFFEGWGPQQTYKETLSAGKALAGGILAGPVGAVVGASMGKKMVIYACKKCGFSQTYKQG